MAKVYSYTRFSTPDQASGDSLRRQTAKARRWAEKNGHTLDDSLTLHDEGISAFRGRNVKAGALGEFLDLVKRGVVRPGEILYLEAWDRFTRRDPWSALPDITTIITSGIAIVASDTVYDDERLRQDRHALGNLIHDVQRGHDESERKSEMVREAWAEKRANLREKPLTATGPAWLVLEGSEWKVKPGAEAVILRIFREYIAGFGLDPIARDLNQDAVPVFESRRTAPHWRRSYIVKLLDNPAVVGTFVPHVVVDGRRSPLDPVPDYYPRIIPQDLWEAARALRTSNASPSWFQGEVRNAFGGGLMRCGLCDSAVMRHAKGPKDRPRLICSRAKYKGGCKQRTVALELVEGAVVVGLPMLIDQAPAGFDAEEELARAKRLAEAYEMGLLDAMEDAIRDHGMDDYTGRYLADLAERRRLAERHVKDLAELVERAGDRLVRQRMEKLGSALAAHPLDRAGLNAALRAAVQSMTLHIDFHDGRVRGPKPAEVHGRVVVTWRHSGEGTVRF